jgi:hypothetical protein
MQPNAPFSPGLSKEEPELSVEDDIPTPAADEAESKDDEVATDRDKPSRE